MPNKLRINIDLAKIQGALWFTSPKTGEKCLVIVPSRARMKHYKAKQEGKEDSLYGAIEVVPLKDGPNDRDETHFVVEPTTKEERESRDAVRLPILGMAREYDTWNKGNTQPPARHQSAATEAFVSADADSDEIPF